MVRNVLWGGATEALLPKLDIIEFDNPLFRETFFSEFTQFMASAANVPVAQVNITDVAPGTPSHQSDHERPVLCEM